jgi:hypothetical protein
LNCTTDKDLSEIFVVIFLADFNNTWERETSHQIQNKYPKLIEEGTIQVIGTQKEFYPQLDNLQHTFNDSEARTKWRSNISERSLSVVQFKSESKVLKIYVAFVLRTVGIPIVRYPKIGNKLNIRYVLCNK